jgi:porin
MPLRRGSSGSALGVGPRSASLRLAGAARWAAAHALAGAVLWAAALAVITPAGHAMGPSDREALTGDWGGARTALAARGVTLGAVYSGEVVANLAGGARRKTVYLDNVHLTLAADAGKLAGWTGTSFFLYGLGIDGANPSESVGDVQGVSNLAGYPTWKLYEAWVQRNFPGLGLSVLAGLYDLNSEFDDMESADLFANASQGIDPTFAFSGTSGPSIFPTTTIGARLVWMPTPSLVLQTAILDGVAGDPGNPRGTHVILSRRDGALWATEAAYLVPSCSAAASPGGGRRIGRCPSTSADGRRRIGRFAEPSYDAKLAVGIWYYTAALEAVDRPDEADRRVHGDPGLYLLGDAWLYRHDADPARGVTAFGRLGWADPRVDRFAFYAGGGLTYRGPIPGRGDDAIGAALASAFNGSDYRRSLARAGAPVGRAETDLEIFYRAAAAPWLTIQPDLQYVIGPDADPRRSNALSLDLRVTVAF